MTTAIYLPHREDRQRKAFDHLLEHTTLGDAVELHEWEAMASPRWPLSGGQAAVWHFAAALANHGSILNGLGAADDDHRRACVEALALLLGVDR